MPVRRLVEQEYEVALTAPFLCYVAALLHDNPIQGVGVLLVVAAYGATLRASPVDYFFFMHSNFSPSGPTRVNPWMSSS
jgi:hypothetical protein